MLQKLKGVIAYVIQVNEVLPTLFQLIAITPVYKHKCTRLAGLFEGRLTLTQG